MKFSDGYWMTREGVRVAHPVEVHDVEAGPNSLTVYAPVRRITRRDDTLNTPVVTVTCTSPMPDVIAVTIGHFLGGRPGPAPVPPPPRPRPAGGGGAGRREPA